MQGARPNTAWRLLVQAVQAATEYVLVVVWGTALLFGLLLAHGPHGYDRFYSDLLWAMLEMRTFLFWGFVLFFAMWGLHRAGVPMLGLHALAAISAPVLAILIARHSFFNLLDQPGYYFLGPMIFLGEFVLCAFLYGVWLLPRHFKPDARPRLHIHFAVLALFLPFVPSLILHAANPRLPGPILSFARAKVVHHNPVIFARWSPSTEALAVEPFDMHLPPPRGGLIPEPDYGGGYVDLTEEEKERLRSAGITGGVNVLGNTNVANAGRVVIILSRQIEAPFQFFAPAEGSDVIYIQTSDGWRKLPPEAGESKSLVRFYIPAGKPNITGVEFDTAEGYTGRDETRYVWDR